MAVLATSPRPAACHQCGAKCSKCEHLASPKVDHWASRYVSGSPQPQSAEKAAVPVSPKRSSFGPSLGFGMPSRISKDLQSSPNGLSAPSGDKQRERPASQDYSAPIIQGSDGGLSKVCGSLIDPAESRNKWACAGCSAVFARDSTLYAAPASLQHKDASYYCRDCYAERYSLGKCVACSRDVLGSTKDEGKYVKAAAGLWHGKCWKCTRCEKSDKDGVEVIVGMDGQPCCEDCFGKPKLRSSPSPTKAVESDLKADEVRRLTRVAGAGTGPMGATIAELSTRLGKQSISSAPRPNVQSNARTPINVPRSASPTKSAYAFPNHVSHSPPKPGMTQSGSITGSPPKPRPLTAQFNGGLNLAAFQSTFAAKEGEDVLVRKDSRSRSVSPVKRALPSPAVRPEEGKEQRQTLEPAQGSTRCNSCHLLPFERPGATGTKEALMISLAGDITLHAECFRCALCEQQIDGTAPFTRLETESAKPIDDLKAAFAHPRCSPLVRRHVVQTNSADVTPKGEKSYRSTPETPPSSRSHATHQRELRPSPVAPPAAAPRTQEPSPIAATGAEKNAVMRRFQPTAGAAPPSRSAVLSSRPAPAGGVNPAAGIFSRLSALSAASNVDLVSTTGTSTGARYGGMQACAFCGTKVSALESVLGPRNTQWHKTCLVCRGTPAPPPTSLYVGRNKAPAVCGKKLDSGAKVTPTGEVRCRDCYNAESSAFRIT